MEMFDDLGNFPQPAIMRTFSPTTSSVRRTRGVSFQRKGTIGASSLRSLTPPARLFVSALLLAVSSAAAFGQSPWAIPLLETNPSDRVLIRDLAVEPMLNDDPGPRSHAPKPWLFQMPARSLFDRVWFSSDDDPPGSSEDVDGDERFQMWVGWDNPFFDFRQAGSPGGVGYEQLFAQYLLADNAAGSWLLNCQAVEPAGTQFGGLSEYGKGHAPTVVQPSVSWFHDLAGGLSLQSFVGTSTRANLGSVDNLNRNFQYGMALQSPLPVGVDSKQFSLFVEALGCSRPESITGQAPPGGWQLLPGLCWQSSQRCWITGGLMMPFGTPRADTGLWHVTCSWNF